jgi:N-acetylneuraminate synthase
METRKAVQKVFVSARPIRAGVPLSAEDLCLRRASQGLGPAELPRLLGATLNRDLDGGRVITPDLLS